MSTDTIAGGIANTSIFAREPEIYAYGMMIALFVAALWQTIGSYMGWNVSSTHSISKRLDNCSILEVPALHTASLVLLPSVLGDSGAALVCYQLE